MQADSLKMYRSMAIYWSWQTVYFETLDRICWRKGITAVSAMEWKLTAHYLYLYTAPKLPRRSQSIFLWICTFTLSTPKIKPGFAENVWQGKRLTNCIWFVMSCSTWCTWYFLQSFQGLSHIKRTESLLFCHSKLFAFLISISFAQYAELNFKWMPSSSVTSWGCL